MRLDVLRDHDICLLSRYLRESNLLLRLINHPRPIELPGGVLLQLDNEWLLARWSLNPQLFDISVFRVCTIFTPSNIFDRSALPNLFMVELDLLSHFFEV